MIEKTHSSERPANYWYDKLSNGNVDIYISDNIKEVEEGFEFDLYKHTTKWTNNLVERIESNFEEFKLNARKQTIKLANEKEIKELKKLLAETDYKALKYAEGYISSVDYEPTKLYRNGLRERINNLEEVN